MVKQRGTLLMVIAVLLVVVSAFAATYVAMSVNTTKSVMTMAANNTAFSLAMAGIEQGSYQLSLGNCSSSWSASAVISGTGQYSYNCTQYNATTTATSALTISQSTVPVASVSNLATFGAITIDSETMFYNGISGNTLQNVRRGMNGTAAATHLINATVSQSQYVIGGQGGYPYLTSGMVNAKVTLYQSVYVTSTMSYIVAGTNGTAGVILTYNGTSWSTSFTAPNNFTFYDIFMSSTYGQAVGYNTSNQGSIYQYSGGSWSSVLTGVINTLFNAVGCDIPLNPTNCWVGGRGGTNDGMLYNSGTQYFASGGGTNYIMAGISCNTGSCMAVGRQHTYAFSSTGTPNMASPVDLATQLNEVHCPSSSRCLAARSGGRLYYYNGSSWSSAVAPPGVGGNSLNGVYCPNTSTCVVVGDTGRIYSCALPAVTCTAQTAPGTIDLDKVYCNSATDCLAIASGSSNVAYRYIGGNWISVPLPASYTLNGVTGLSGGGTSIVTPTVLIQQ